MRVTVIVFVGIGKKEREREGGRETDNRQSEENSAEA